MPTPPIADRRPHTVVHHGVTLIDDYAWLRDPGYPAVTDPDILSYLEAENAYFEGVMAPHRPLVEAIFEELKGRVAPDDASVPVRDGEFDYWWRFDAGAQYRRWWRRGVDGTEQQVLDENVLAAGHDYFRLGATAVSPDGRLLAYAIDDDGSERFKLRVRDLATGKDLGTVTDASIGAPVWTADSRSLLWTELSAEWRPYRLRLHRLGSSGEDALLYEETDTGMRIGIGRSTDRSHIVMGVGDHVTSEAWLIPTHAPATPPRLVSPRQTGRQYDVDVRGETLFIRTNDTHINFRIVTAPLASPGAWSELIAPDDRRYIRGLTAFASYLAIAERRDGLDQICLLDDDRRETLVAFPEASYTASLGVNSQPDAPLLRLSYTSMVTPQTVFDYDVATATLATRKVQAIPSGYDASAYVTERLWATARDGMRVPVSVVYRRDFAKDGGGRLALYGYGAYGIAISPAFSANRLSLLDRGFAFAIAHIRGGDDLGYGWYLDGKLEKRTNTFNDFVDVARFLVGEGFAAAGNIAISGGSAGGELMGAVINSDPSLWRAVAAHVPFVDVLNTMLDATLPLTPGEWPEWGNPITDPAAFETIRSYSPYDNVKAQPVPPLLITAGLNDPRVTYWEPAKWAAKLRATRTNDAPLLLKTNMGAGHGGKSGRFTALHEIAEEYAFMLMAYDDPA